ncbi:hypothetical protein D3C76_852040 [compost metagenome]
MIGDHVAQGPGVVIERTAGFDADGLGGGDLHVVDVVVVPERLEQAVGEAADQNVLHRLFAQVMVDAVDLPLAHHLQQTGVECLGAGKVSAKGFLHHDATKATGRLVEQAGLAQAQGHFGEETWRGGQVEDRVAMTGRFDALGNRLVRGRIKKVAGLVVQPFGQPRPQFFVQALGAALAALVTLQHEGVQALGERLGGGGIVIDANDAQVAVQQPVTAEVVQRRHQQALDQVAIGAEQKQGAGRRCRDRLFSHSPFFSTCPPKPRRMAESILSPYVPCC